jgi:hypothetical protein
MSPSPAPNTYTLHEEKQHQNNQATQWLWKKNELIEKKEQRDHPDTRAPQAWVFGHPFIIPPFLW